MSEAEILATALAVARADYLEALQNSLEARISGSTFGIPITTPQYRLDIVEAVLEEETMKLTDGFGVITERMVSP